MLSKLSWYDDKKLIIDPLVENEKQVTLVGIADYNNNPSGHNVVVKIETGSSNDYFVGFNRAVGVNAQNDEGSNVVTVIQVDGRDGEGYSQSYLKAKLGFVGDTTGSLYTIPNFAGTTSPLNIEVLEINVGVNPATATVNFHYKAYSGTDDCSAENFLSATFTTALEGKCWKAELFEGGVLAADSSDIDCSSESPSFDEVYSIFDYVEGDRIYFKEGDLGYTGYFEFTESPLTSRMITRKSWNDAAKFFSVRFIFSSCSNIRNSLNFI